MTLGEYVANNFNEYKLNMYYVKYHELVIEFENQIPFYYQQDPYQLDLKEIVEAHVESRTNRSGEYVNFIDVHKIIVKDEGDVFGTIK